MIKPFAWFLLNHRKKGYKLVEPEKVTMATELYRKKNDIYRQYLDEQTVDDANHKVSIDEIYSGFKDWHKDSFPGQQVPPKSEVREYCTKAWGEPQKRGSWMGKRLYGLDDEKNEEEKFELEPGDLE